MKSKRTRSFSDLPTLSVCKTTAHKLLQRNVILETVCRVFSDRFPPGPAIHIAKFIRIDQVCPRHKARVWAE